MVYNGNVRCRGVQVLLRWKDIVESTSSDPGDEQWLYQYGMHSTDIHMKS